MKHSLRFALVYFFGLTLLANLAWARPDPVSPEVLPDGRVTFRVLAPKAQAVAVQRLSGFEPAPMTKDETGLWSVTVGPLPPELYSYTFDVDGATFTDPLNRRMKEWILQESLVEVPGKEPLLFSRQDVPHGVMQRHVIPSSVRGTDVAVQIYTPPGFDPKAATVYPVLYLLHGSGDDENSWGAVGRTNFIADNLLAKNQITPVIMVIANCHPVPIPQTWTEEYYQKNEAPMEQELLTVILPYVEGHFPVRRDAASRAIAGNSMGGRYALGIGLNHPERFDYVGGFSTGFSTISHAERYGVYARAVAQKTAYPRLLWIGCGEKERLLDRNKSFITWLEQNKLPHECHFTAGEHGWTIWRGYLAQYLQKIFR